jgi:hypothetical protein
MATVQIQQETMALSNSAQRQALSCSSSAHLLPIRWVGTAVDGRAVAGRVLLSSIANC